MNDKNMPREEDDCGPVALTEKYSVMPMLLLTKTSVLTKGARSKSR